MTATIEKLDQQIQAMRLCAVHEEIAADLIASSRRKLIRAMRQLDSAEHRERHAKVALAISMLDDAAEGLS